MSDDGSERQAARGDLRKALSDEAIDWVVRLGSGRASPADRRAFQAWRHRSASHEAAAIDAERLLEDVGRTQSAATLRDQTRPSVAGGTRRLAATPTGPRRATMRRRTLLTGTIAASAALILLGAGAIGPVSGLYADHATVRGERRRIPLPDGSQVFLNTATALSADFSGAARRVTLHAGEALFDVALDVARPFQVAAAGGETQAIGTIFAIRRDGGETLVQVAEGAVQVGLPGTVGEKVRAGQRLRYGNGRITAPADGDVDAAIAWHRGKLIFNRRPLGEVLAELQRYRYGRLLVADEGLARMPISGVFDLDDPDQLLRTIEASTPARVTRLPLLTLVRRK